jgi:L-lactate dehydrogenase
MPADQAIANRREDPTVMRRTVEQEVRYANIAIIEGIGASQLGIGMVSARIVEIVARDELAAIPIGVFNPKFGVDTFIASDFRPQRRQRHSGAGNDRRGMSGTPAQRRRA